MEEKINNNINDNRKIGYALSAIMFFAPLIKYNLKSDNSFSQQEKLYLNGFIKFGYINIVLLAFAIVSQIIYMNTKTDIFQNITTGLLVATAILLIIGSILAIFQKNINLSDSEGKADFDKIFCFIPLYNIYIRYKNHNFEGENNTIKLGIFLRSIYSILLVVSHNLYLNLIFFILILLCAIAATTGISLGEKIKKSINNLFKKNPEEIFGYIIGPIASLFNKKRMSENIQIQKSNFEFLFKYDTKEILVEYIMFGIICVLFIVVGIKNWNYQMLVGMFLIISRYLIMLLNWKHLPHMPILGEIVNIFFSNKSIKNE